MSDYPTITYDRRKGQWFDQDGNPFDPLHHPLTKGRAVVVCGMRWHEVMILARTNEELRAMLPGTVQSRCAACGELVALSKAIDDAHRHIPSLCVLCMDCAVRAGLTV